MGRKSALVSNGFKEGTKEYNFWIDKMIKLEGILNKLQYEKLTYYKIHNICIKLNEFEKSDFQFTIGDIDYRDLKKFLSVSLNILDLKFMTLIIRDHIGLMEINPIEYGYKKDILPLIINLKSIRDKYYKN